MASTTLKTRVQMKYDTLANWLASTFETGTAAQYLKKGELAIVKDDDTIKIKCGNGTSKFSDLPYIGGEGGVEIYAADNSLNLATDGGLKVKTSAATGNAFEVKTDGVFVQKITNTDKSIDVATDGVVKVNKSATTNNAIELKADGLFAQKLTNTDKSIDIDTNGVVKVNSSAATGNAVELKTDGLFVQKITNSDKSIDVATDGVVKVNKSATDKNAIELKTDGLYVKELTKDDDYGVTIVKDTTSSDYAAIYKISQGGTQIATTIDIPKDMVVSSGAVETDPAGKPAGTYLVLTLANATSDKVYINVSNLIEYVTAGDDTATGHVEVSTDHKVTMKVKDGSIGQTQLDTATKASLALADTAIQEDDLADIATSGDAKDLTQTAGDYLLLDCGTATTNV